MEKVVEGIASDAQLAILLFGFFDDSGHVLLVGVLTVREGRLANFAQRRLSFAQLWLLLLHLNQLYLDGQGRLFIEIQQRRVM